MAPVEVPVEVPEQWHTCTVSDIPRDHFDTFVNSLYGVSLEIDPAHGIVSIEAKGNVTDSVRMHVASVLRGLMAISAVRVIFDESRALQHD